MCAKKGVLFLFLFDTFPLIYSFIFYFIYFIFLRFYLFMIEAETQAKGEAGSMHREPDVGLDPGSPGSRPGPRAGAKPLRHAGIPPFFHFFLLTCLLVTRKSTRDGQNRSFEVVSVDKSSEAQLH